MAISRRQEGRPQVQTLLDDREVDPLAENWPRAVVFRLVVASNRDLRAEVAAGRIRTDLFTACQ